MGELQTLAENSIQTSRHGDAVLLAALVTGRGVRAAAKLTGIGERTIYTRLRDAEFKSELDRLKTEILDQVTFEIANASTKAVETLKELLDARSDGVRLGAARALLDLHFRARDQREANAVCARLDELEETLCRLTGGIPAV